MIALPWLLGAAGLAHALADTTPTEDHDGFEGFLSRRRSTWDAVIGLPQAPLGHEWMVTAEWVAASRRADVLRQRNLSKRAALRFETPMTEPLCWLLEHPESTFAVACQALPIGPFRFSWIGNARAFLRSPGLDELHARTKGAFDRLDGLAREHRFPVVLLTYLNYEHLDANNLLRRIAREREWPLIDLHQRHERQVLAADDKRKWFSADRGHPNAAGYSLMADAVHAELIKLAVVH